MRAMRWLAVALLALGSWVVAAPYAGPALGFVVRTTAETEVVTHVVPGVPVLAVAAFVLVSGRFPLPAALVAVLAGMWMAGTHLPLVFQAFDGGVDMGSALWHSIPGTTIFVVAVAAATIAWLDERARERAATPRS